MIPAPATPVVPALTATVFNGGNVREAPMRGKPLDQINAHETVQLLGKTQSGDWYLIINQRGVSGWVSATLLTIDAAIARGVPTMPPTAAQSATLPNGFLATPVPGQPTTTPLPDDHVPPSLPIAKLAPFTHASTGISGLRPDNWTLFSGVHSFQISSSPAAPDGFIGTLITPDKYPTGGAAQASRDTFDTLKKNQADGPPPVIRESAWAADGAGTLLIEISGHAQGSTRAFRFVTYARITPTSKGLLFALAQVPADQFAVEQQFIRQMVDSLKLDADAASAQSAAGLTVRGLRRERRRDPTGALADYMAAIKLDASYADAYFYRGDLRISLGDQEAGMQDYQRAKQLDPDPAKAAYHLGRIDDDLGNSQAALQSYAEAIRLKPTFDQAYYSRGVSRYIQGDNLGAIEDYTQAIQINPNFAEAYYNRGNARRDTGDSNGATQDFGEALRADPDFGDAYFNRASIYSDSGAYQQAIDDFTAAIRLENDLPHAYYGRGYAYSKLDDTKAAIADYTTAIRLKPDYAAAYCDRGAARIALGDNKGAIQDTTKALDLDPDWICAHYTRGRAYYNNGNYPKAIADLTVYLERFPNEPFSHLYRGMARYQTNDYAGAVDDETAALRFEPNDPRIYETRGLAQAKLGDQQAARADLQQAADLYQQEGNQAAYNRVTAAIKQLPSR